MGSGADEESRASAGTEVVPVAAGLLGQSRSLTLAGLTQFGQSPGERPPVRASAPLLRGDVVGRYVIIMLLGHGGMGVVHAAYDPELDRRVALKLLLAGGASSSKGACTRLLREAQALAQLSHSNVVAVYEPLPLKSPPFRETPWISTNRGFERTAVCQGAVRRGQDGPTLATNRGPIPSGPDGGVAGAGGPRGRLEKAGIRCRSSAPACSPSTSPW